LSGREYSVEETVAEVLKDKLFFDVSGGGVTLSGGEPLAQSEFIAELLIALKQQGIHTAIETCGEAEWSVFERIMDYTDLFLFDIKHLSSRIHEMGTGVGNERILSNFQLLTKRNQDIIVRVPQIPNYNADIVHLRKLERYVRDHGVSHLEFLPYHRLGQSKYTALGRAQAVYN
jgi:pyruvate formate lyase activating enzyme